MDDRRTHDALRELAEMYLTGGPVDATDSLGAAPGPADDAPAPALTAERVIVGHLPGMANLWLHQYAQTAGEQAGVPIAVWRIESQAVELDILNAGDNGHSIPPLHGATLDEVIALLAARGTRSLVVTLEPPPAALSAAIDGLGCWTLLSGADEAALVAGYRSIKQQLDARLAADTPPPAVRVMFLGVRDELAQRAGAQLQRTAERFVDLPITVLGARQKMGPVRRVHVGRFVFDDAALATLTELLGNCLPAHEAPPPEASASENQPEPTAESGEPTLHLTRPVDETGPLDDEERAALEEPFSDLDDADDRDESAPAADQAEPSRQATVAAATGPGPLSQYVADLRPLQARWPRDGSIELGIDGRGRLHLLLHHTGDAGPDAAVRRLAEARQWAIEHLPLLRLTCPRRALADEPPRAHLFTAHPKPCLSLAAAGLVQLHLLRPMTPGHQTRWTHIELS